MPERRSVSYWVEKLALEPHPEGGYYRETYRASLQIEKAALPATFGGRRNAATAIYFLIDGANFSAFHRIASDEMWHFYSGAALAVEVIDPTGRHSRILLGDDPAKGELFQATVPAGCWFASHVADDHSYSLVGCTVSPGFDFADFEIADRALLSARFPQHRELIERLTRI